MGWNIVAYVAIGTVGPVLGMLVCGRIMWKCLRPNSGPLFVDKTPEQKPEQPKESETTDERWKRIQEGV